MFMRRARRRRIARRVALLQLAEDKARPGEAVGFGVGLRIHSDDAQGVVDAEPYRARPGRHRGCRIEPGECGFQGDKP
jgi:hypothetical protein